jgi:hypothetical protein
VDDFTLATEPSLHSPSAATEQRSLVIRLSGGCFFRLDSLAGPTASNVSFACVRTDTRVTESYSLTALFVAALTSAWRETAGGCRGTCCTTTCKTPAYRMVDTCEPSVNQHYVRSEVVGYGIK